MVSIVSMHNIQVFKRQGQTWHERPTGGRHLQPPPPRVEQWLKSDFAQQLLNKSVKQ
jgi:hypothetical protein